MAIVLPPTLMQVRQSVAIRLNIGPQAAQSDAMKNILDEFIRKAARELILKAHWVELRIRYSVNLIDGQTTYDFPDNMEPGRIERLIVVDKSGCEYTLQRGIQPHERAQFTEGKDPRDMPLRYEIVNQDIVVLPAPDTERYPTLLVEGFTRPPSPRNNDDRIPVDEEALIQWATAAGKLHFNHPDAAAYEAKAQQYVKDLRPMQSAEDEAIQIGGHFSRKFQYQQRRRVGTSVPAGQNYWLLP